MYRFVIFYWLLNRYERSGRMMRRLLVPCILLLAVPTWIWADACLIASIAWLIAVLYR